MQVTRERGTQHISVDMPRLKAFLLEQHFEPEIVNELHFVLLAEATQQEIADEIADDYPEAWDMLLACAGKDAATLQRELLTLIRQTTIEEANAPWDNSAAEKTWSTWGQPDEESQDAQLFVASAPAGLVFCDGAIYPFTEYDAVIV